MRKIAVILLVLAFLLSGCNQKASLDAPTPQAALSATPALLITTPLSSSTPTPTLTSILPTPSATLTPTPVLDPMSIPAMRLGTYPGSEITIEKELDPGSNYRRYYASYLSEGLKIYALLTVPDGKMPVGGYPAIVFNHGYIPPKQYRTTERYIAYVDWLARAGYVVFRIDYRGNGSSEGVATGAYGNPGYTVDVLNAVASLERYPQVNPQKIGMWGHSMGGFLTLRAMVISRDIKAGVIWSGVVGSYYDLFYNWRHIGSTPTPPPESRGWRSSWVEQYGTPQENPRFWDMLSANSYVADLSGPLQLHHSLADSEVPEEFSQKLTDEIQAVGGTVELYTYQGDDHNLAGPFAVAMTRTIQFFDRYLK
jgi:dipeptidyl aminopeptidase/acylaminoacyl peptidase